MDKHDLLHEFPAFREQILTLQKQSNRFRKLSEDYHEADNYIHRIEEGFEATTDEHLNELRMKRVHLKDQLYKMLLKETDTVL
jgi:uncharacterized protein YdcH (DUF465 family)